MDEKELNFELDNADTEDHLVSLICAYLLKPEHKIALAPYDLTIYDLLNGRWQSSQTVRDIVKGIFNDWNEQLGQIQFGRFCGLGIE